jgi:phosphate:Na+ symporter
MLEELNIWQMLAGVAIFLLGISFMEEALKRLAGRRFKLFLKQQTTGRVRAILGGAIVTAFMQSSSVVNLLLLSFVGAGIIKMQQALAVMLGSNLGTTFTSWLITTFGFRLDIELLSLPLLALAGTGYFLTRNGTEIRSWFRFFTGFSFLFIGLAYINESMAGIVAQTDFSKFSSAPLLVFIVIGFIITALVQSSSITIALALSALFHHVISLPVAAALVLGAEIGTTVKLALASIDGIAAKKRVALGNILFNTVTSFVVILFLHPVLYFITEILKIADALYALVVFQSLINLVGIVLFFPFLNLFGNFLEKSFRDETALEFLKKVNPAEVDVAMVGMEKETRHFIQHLFVFGKKVFDLGTSGNGIAATENAAVKKTTQELYDHIKIFYGELHAFYIRLQHHIQSKQDTERMDQLSTCIRNSMYAAKSLKDAVPDLEQLKNSSNDVKFELYQELQANAQLFFTETERLLSETNGEELFSELVSLYHRVQDFYAVELKKMYKEARTMRLTATETSTVLNLNRELTTAFKSMVFALKDLLLQPGRANYFDELPGFIR